MDKKMTQRLDAMSAECMSIWGDEDIDVSIRSKALRLYADIYEDLCSLDYEGAPRRYTKAIIREYDEELTTLYGEF